MQELENTVSEIREVKETDLISENPKTEATQTPEIPAAPQAEQINEVAKPVTAADVIEHRKRGRPKGSGKKKETEIPTTPEAITPQSELNLAGGSPEVSPENPSIVPDPASAINAPSVDYQFLARLTVNMGTNTLAMVFGPEWNPEDENEAVQLTNAIAAYLKAKDVQDIPPGALLAIVICTYSAKRFRAPSTREKLYKGWLWVKSKISRKKLTAPKPSA